MAKSFYISIIVAAILLFALTFFLYAQDERYDLVPLIIGNMLLATMSILSFTMIKKGLDKSGHALLRAKYTSMLMKFAIGFGAFFGYFFYVGKEHLYRPMIFLFLGMYVVYAALEAIPLSKVAKKH